MDHAMLLEHLALASRHVARGDRHLHQQRRIVARMAVAGHDSELERDVLRTFENLQALHTAHRDRLLFKLKSALV